MVLMAFFDSQADMRDSDSDRQEFARCYLKDLRFLYKDSKNEDKKVRHSKCPHPSLVITSEYLFRSGRGSFVVHSSSSLSVLILLPLKVLWMFPTSTMISHLLRWLVGLAWPLPR